MGDSFLLDKGKKLEHAHVHEEWQQAKERLRKAQEELKTAQAQSNEAEAAYKRWLGEVAYRRMMREETPHQMLLGGVDDETEKNSGDGVNLAWLRDEVSLLWSEVGRLKQESVVPKGKISVAPSAFKTAPGAEQNLSTVGWDDKSGTSSLVSRSSGRQEANVNTRANGRGVSWDDDKSGPSLVSASSERQESGPMMHTTGRNVTWEDKSGAILMSTSSGRGVDSNYSSFRRMSVDDGKPGPSSLTAPALPSGGADPNLCIFANGTPVCWNENYWTSPFVEVAADPFHSFQNGAFVIWMRQCYKDMAKVIEEYLRNGAYTRFVLSGTSGIGKSFFGILWVVKLAAEGRKVVWKIDTEHYHLLDFTTDDPKVAGPLEARHLDIVTVLRDPSAWLVLDGRLETVDLRYPCKMLLIVAFPRPRDFAEFIKNGTAVELFLPVWSVAETKQFLQDFEPYRRNYGNMHVNEKEDALKYFEELGGVARYVLDSRKSDPGLRKLGHALRVASQSTLLNVLAGNHVENLSDSLIHIVVDDTTFIQFKLCFASKSVEEKLFQKLRREGGDVEKIHWLNSNFNNEATESYWSTIFELVCHSVLRKGGKFQCKRVHENGRYSESLLELKVVLKTEFSSLDEFSTFSGDTYCQPTSAILESIDPIVSIITPNRLFHIFGGGRHGCAPGLKVSGVVSVDKALQRGEGYRLYTVVPKTLYETTGFQPWLNSEGGLYQANAKLPSVIGKCGQFVLCLD